MRAAVAQIFMWMALLLGPEGRAAAALGRVTSLRGCGAEVAPAFARTGPTSSQAAAKRQDPQTDRFCIETLSWTVRRGSRTDGGVVARATEIAARNRDGKSGGRDR